MLLSHFPEEIVEKYNLKALAVDGWVYIEIRKRHVRIKTSMIARQPTVTKASGTFWLLSCPAHTWTLAAQNTANRFLPHSG
jgi:hypothetical protein